MTTHRAVVCSIAMCLLASQPSQQLHSEEPPYTTELLADSSSGIDLRDRLASSSSVAFSTRKETSDHASSDHPLNPLLELARQSYNNIVESVDDYTCVLVKRERVDGRLLPAETIFAKVQHASSAGANEHPCRVYLCFQAPASLKGRELLFSHSGDDAKLLVRNGGRRLPFLTLELSPTCALAMHGNRYPVTEFGIQRLVERMILLGERELAYPDECEVNIHQGVEFDGRKCQQIEVCHPHRREHFAYHLARITIDSELQVPVRFQAYDWPAEAEGEPVLIEDYAYLDLKLNTGLQDEDFSRENPDYQFR